MKDAATIAVPGVSRASALADYFALTKPRLNFLVVASSAAGYYLGAPGSIDAVAMTTAVAGTALVAGGAAALNQVYERDTDALMRRTRLRPLPDGRIGHAEGRLFGLGLSLAGVALLAGYTNLLAAALALATLGIYLIVYTPMKRTSSASTLVGAIPGALPPLIGWAASHGSLSRGGLALFTIVFLWQIPHFMAISWMYRDDYGKAGFPMLAVVDPEGRRASRFGFWFALLLVPFSLEPTFAGVTGQVYFWIALILGVAMLWLALRFAQRRTDAAARTLFFASITYLPLLWIAMIANKL